MTDYFSMEPMRYWSMPTTTSADARKLKLQQMIDSEDYLFGRKYDGNWSRAVITKDRDALQLVVSLL